MQFLPKMNLIQRNRTYTTAKIYFNNFNNIKRTIIYYCILLYSTAHGGLIGVNVIVIILNLYRLRRMYS